MSVKVAEQVPDVTVFYNPVLDEADACGIPQPFHIHKELKGKTAVIVTVPGAFTGPCHKDHLPDYVTRYDEFRAKGVDVVLVLSTNDQFVMHAWAQKLNAGKQILFLGNANGDFAQQVGLASDTTKIGLGPLRFHRAVLIVKDLKIVYSAVEENDLQVTVTSAAEALKHL